MNRQAQGDSLDTRHTAILQLAAALFNGKDTLFNLLLSFTMRPSSIRVHIDMHSYTDTNIDTHKRTHRHTRPHAHTIESNERRDSQIFLRVEGASLASTIAYPACTQSQKSALELFDVVNEVGS